MPVNAPSNEPVAALIALRCPRYCDNSAINTPINIPGKAPNGGMSTSPTIEPASPPQKAFLEAPKILAPIKPAKKSTRKEIINIKKSKPKLGKVKC